MANNSAYNKEYYKRNAEKIKERSRLWHKNNPDKVRAIRNKYKKKRYKSDVLYRLETNIRNRINDALRLKYKKPRSTLVLLGIDSMEDLRSHIESRFLPGMTWDNRSEWCIDHFVPIANYDLSDEKQLLEAFNYINLVPIWKKDNEKKGARLPFTLRDMKIIK